MENLDDGSYEQDIADLIRLYVLDVSSKSIVHLKDCEDALSNGKNLEDAVSGQLS